MFFSTSGDTNPVPESETTPENHVTRKNVTGRFPNILYVKDNHIPSIVLKQLNFGFLPTQGDTQHLFAAIFDECIRYT